MKLSLIVEGGGMRVAYALGAVGALHSHFGLKKVDYVTGCSSSLGLLAYYVAGQLYPGYHQWPQEFQSKKLLSLFNLFRGRPILDIDYLIDKVYKNHIPLNEKKIKNSKIKFFVPLVNAKTGKLKYYDNRTNENFFEVLRAGMAMQIGYGKTVMLNNIDYFDAGSLNPLPIDIPQIKKSKKIIILTKKKGKNKGHWSDDFFIRLFKKHFSAKAYEVLRNHGKVYKEKVEQVSELESHGDIVIRPQKYFSRYSNNKETLKKLMEIGYKDASRSKKITELVNQLKKTKRAPFYFS